MMIAGVLRAEVLKLLRSSSLVAALAVTAVLAVSLSIFLAAATRQQQYVDQTAAYFGRPASMQDLCASAFELPVGPECERARQEQLGFLQDFIQENRERFRLGAVAQDPLGVGGLAAGMMASLVGLIALGAVAGGHTAGEWTQGTVRPLLAKQPSRGQFVVVKFLTTWLVGVGLLLVTWAALLVLVPLFREWYVVPAPPPGFRTAPFVVSRVAKAVLVLGVFAALATAAAVITRHQLGTIAVLLGVAFFGMAGAATQATVPFSFGYWVAAWMGFAPADLWADHLWVDQFPFLNPEAGLVPDPGVGLLGLLASATLTLLLAITLMRRADV
jgi:ABC-type transport system involved in multi-copper enzyme maturation permease subunit